MMAFAKRMLGSLRLFGFTIIALTGLMVRPAHLNAAGAVHESVR